MICYNCKNLDMTKIHENSACVHLPPKTAFHGLQFWISMDEFNLKATSRPRKETFSENMFQHPNRFQAALFFLEKWKELFKKEQLTFLKICSTAFDIKKNIYSKCRNSFQKNREKREVFWKYVLVRHPKISIPSAAVLARENTVWKRVFTLRNAPSDKTKWTENEYRIFGTSTLHCFPC